MKKLLLRLTLMSLLLTAVAPLYAATYKGTITIKVGETMEINIGSGYMSSYVTVSGSWSKSNSTFIIQSTSQKRCTIKGNQVGSGKLYWYGFIIADSWDFYWDVNVVSSDVKVTSISLSPSTLNLEVGKSEYISETIYPSNATNKNVSWTSSNSSIATVNNSGQVKAVSPGTATITCKAIDGSGITATCKVTVTKPDVVVAEINSTNFPDDSFRSWLLSQSYGADGKLTESEISNIVSISVSGSYSSPGTIKSLKGIEYFTSLKYLYCSYNQLTSLDVSKLTALTSLSCYNNQLTSLDVSKQTSLTSLSCDNNQLTSLDVSRLTALTSLDCDKNHLTTLNVSNLTALKTLSCCNNQLTSLDVSRLTALTSLSCDDNQLTSLDVSRLTALTFLSCYNNQLKLLDVSNLTALATLQCFDNQLTSLDVSRLTALTFLSCYNNQLKLLDVSNLTALKSLYCSNNQLTSLDVSRLTALTYLSCYNNQLTSLDVSRLTALTSLSCGDNQLTSLDVSRLTALTYLYCSNNQLTSLGVSRLTALTDLSCGDNLLTSLDLSKNTALTFLYCSYNQLTSLDVSRLTSLTSLSCGDNQLTSLDLSKNTALTSLYCWNNQLTSLEVTKNTALTHLSCYNNSIKGTAMDNLINSLPQNKSGEVHRFRVVGQDLANEGNVCTATQVAAVKAKGWLPCYYDSTSKEYVEYKGGDGPSTNKGDVNGDNQVNGTDLVALTNIILGKNAKTDAADVNGDGQVNGTDYVALVNIVLGRSQAPRRAATDAARLSIDPSFDIKAGETKEMAINLTNPNDEITLVQFDLRLPDGLAWEGDVDIPGRTTWRKHSLEANATGGIIRFLLASSSNATLSGTEGGIITITVTADKDFSGGDIKLENILMVSPDEKETKQDTYTYTIGQTSPTPSASAVLAIEPFNIAAGGEAEMVIDLTNPSDEITLVQFDLRLPDGLSVKQTGGEYVYDIADRTTWRKHSLEANATGGIIRFLLASSSNATLSGTEGGIITITVTADKDFSGGDIKLENILMVSPDEKETKQDTYTYTIGQTSPTPSASAVLAIEPFNIAAGGEAEMVIDLTNPSDEITLVQFDLRLPDGLSVKQTGGDYVYDITDRTTWRKHSLEANATGGIIRFLLASSSNATLSGTEGAIITMTLKADNTYKGGTVKLENILLVTPDEKEIKPADLSYNIGSTGISSITMDAIDSNTPIYNLRGQRLAAPQKGINIIGGKKVIVK